MIRTTDQVMTRDGRAARVLSFTERHEEGPYNLPILAEVEHPNEVGGWLRWHYMADGRWKSNGDFNDGNDLIVVRGFPPTPTASVSSTREGASRTNSGGTASPKSDSGKGP